MSALKQSLILAAHIGLLAWILFTAFQTNSLSNTALLLNYLACGASAFALFKVKIGTTENA